VFVGVLLLAVPLTWLGVQLKWIRDRHAALEWIRKQPDYDPSSEGTVVGTFHSSQYVGRPPWSLRILGEPGIARIGIHVKPGATLDNFVFPPGIHELFPEAGIGIYSVGERHEPAAPGDALVAPASN
jgi:hypothetical protein